MTNKDIKDIKTVKLVLERSVFGLVIINAVKKIVAENVIQGATYQELQSETDVSRILLCAPFLKCEDLNFNVMVLCENNGFGKLAGKDSAQGLLMNPNWPYQRLTLLHYVTEEDDISVYDPDKVQNNLNAFAQILVQKIDYLTKKNSVTKL